MRFYVDHGVRFFLFAPTLTLFSGGGGQYMCGHSNGERYHIRKRREREHVIYNELGTGGRHGHFVP